MTVGNADFLKRAGEILEAGMKLKKVMKSKGLRRAKAKCPFCADGFLWGTLNGRRDHLHMACDKCDARMME